MIHANTLKASTTGGFSSSNGFSKFREQIVRSVPLQLLAEEVFHNHLEIVRLCYEIDKTSPSTIDPGMFKALIKKYCRSFADHELDDLVAQSPTDEKGRILYRELSFAIDIYLKKERPPTDHLAGRKMMVESAFESPIRKAESFAAPAPSRLYRDLRLQHLNPGYDNKEAYEFLKNYQSKEALVLDTFKYNEDANEENFMVEVAGLIRAAWLQGGQPALAVFRQFNKQRTGQMSMAEFCEMVESVTKASPLTSAEKVYLFRRVSQGKDNLGAETFVEWLDKHSTRKYKPLINLNVKLLGEFAHPAPPTQEDRVPLIIRKLVEEMREYGKSYIEDAYSLYVAQSTTQLLTRKETQKAVDKPLLITNFQKLFSVLGMPAAIEDIHDLKIWLMEANLAERYVVTSENELGIEVVIKSKELWKILEEMLYKQQAQAAGPGKRLPGNTSDEVIQSMKCALLRKKLMAIEKTLAAYANNEYIKEKDLRHILKSEVPELSPENLGVLIGSFTLVIQPQPLFPFKQFNVPEIMERLERMLIL